jgi:hypothetical protein
MNDKHLTALQGAMEFLCMAADELRAARDIIENERILLREALWHTPVDYDMLTTSGSMEDVDQYIGKAQKVLLHLLGEDELDEDAPSKGTPYAVRMAEFTKEERREFYKEADEQRRAAARALRERALAAGARDAGTCPMADSFSRGRSCRRRLEPEDQGHERDNRSGARVSRAGDRRQSAARRPPRLRRVQSRSPASRSGDCRAPRRPCRAATLQSSLPQLWRKRP